MPVVPRGLGSALKPALEPITVARKPLIGTIAANVLAHGTGALNIDVCRVEGESTARHTLKVMSSKGAIGGALGNQGHEYAVRESAFATGSDMGRWPANLIHDGSEEVLVGFPQHDDCGGSAARFFYQAKASKWDRDEGCERLPEVLAMRYGEKAQGPLPQQTPSKPAAQRNHHPTVKPTDLMRHLLRLVTPPGGIVLDPFMGSGSTGKAARLEGFRFIGIEREADYIAIARARIDNAQRQGLLL